MSVVREILKNHTSPCGKVNWRAFINECSFVCVDIQKDVKSAFLYRFDWTFRDGSKATLENEELTIEDAHVRVGKANFDLD